MTFTAGRYFDSLDVGEACAHETAAFDLGLVDSTPLRDAVGDPTDPARRGMNLAISTLTLRVEATGTSAFPLHWRDPATVGHAGGQYTVIPVGIFQAATEVGPILPCRRTSRCGGASSASSPRNCSASPSAPDRGPSTTTRGRSPSG